MVPNLPGRLLTFHIKALIFCLIVAVPVAVVVVVLVVVVILVWGRAYCPVLRPHARRRSQSYS